DAKGLLIAAINDQNPVIFYEHKLLYQTEEKVPNESYTIPLGEASLKRDGEDVTVIGTGIMVNRALQAANNAEKLGISVEVIDPRTLVPLDEQTIVQSVQKTGRLIIVHEAVKRGGYGGEIASIVAERAFSHLKSPIIRLGGEAVPIPYNSTLEQHAVPQTTDIEFAIKKIFRN